ncbi:MAG: hypothetical protein JWM19_6396 [Actinomycetia bacterium]|nr:hypothetical protein [Actinomycetes bacterium]
MSENFSSQPDGIAQGGIQPRIVPGSRIAGYLIEEQVGSDNGLGGWNVSTRTHIARTVVPGGQDKDLYLYEIP